MLRLRQMPDEVPAEKREMVRLAGRGGYHMARPRRTALGRLALEELVSRYPAEPNVHYALGDVPRARRPGRGASRSSGGSCASIPITRRPSSRSAHLETRRGNVAAALPLAEKARALAPDVPAARLVLGRTLLDLGRTEEAIAQLERAAALAPESGDVQFALSRAYQRAGRTEAATRAREEFLRLEERRLSRGRSHARSQAHEVPGRRPRWRPLPSDPPPHRRSARAQAPARRARGPGVRSADGRRGRGRGGARQEGQARAGPHRGRLHGARGRRRPRPSSPSAWWTARRRRPGARPRRAAPRPPPGAAAAAAPAAPAAAAPAPAGTRPRDRLRVRPPLPQRAQDGGEGRPHLRRSRATWRATSWPSSRSTSPCAPSSPSPTTCRR